MVEEKNRQHSPAFQVRESITGESIKDTQQERLVL